MGDPRKWLMLSESAWLAGLAMAFGLPWWAWLWPLLSYVVLGYRRWSPTVMVLLIVAGLAGPSVFSHLPLVLVTAAALWRGFSLSRNDFLDMRFAFVWGILAAVGEFIARPAWGWIPLLFVVGFSLVAMVPYGKRPLWERWGFAGQLLGAGVGIGLAAAAFLWLVPWGRIIRTVFFTALTPVFWLLKFIPLKQLHSKRTRSQLPFRSKPALPRPKHLAANGPPHLIGLLLIVLGVITALAVLYWLWRYLRRTHQPVADAKDDSAVIHEHIDKPVDWFRSPFAPLPPVRAAVRKLLQEAHKRGHARNESESFREWASALLEEQAPETSLRLYDEVRYGNRADTRESADTFRQDWPAWSNGARPAGLASRLITRRPADPDRTP